MGLKKMGLMMLLTTGLVTVDSRGHAWGRSTLRGGVAVLRALEALGLGLGAERLQGSHFARGCKDTLEYL